MAIGRNHHLRRGSSEGFTLIELLVVIAIIALLVGILVPTLTAAKDQAKAVMCLINQRSIGLACLYWAGDHDQKLPGTSSIHAEISQSLDRIVPANPMDWQRDRVPAVFFCPADPDPYPAPYMGGMIELTSYFFNGAETDYYAGGTPIGLGPFGGSTGLDDLRATGDCMLIGETSHYPMAADLDHPAAADAFARAGAPLEPARRRFHHRATSGFFHGGAMSIYFADGHGETVVGRPVEPLAMGLQPAALAMDPSTTFWLELSLPSATEKPRFWGPPYNTR